MSLIGSSSAQTLLLMLLPLFVFQQSSAASITQMASSAHHPCDDWNNMHEFNIDLKTLQGKVNSCPEDCSLAGMNAECQCLNISKPSEQQSPFPCYFATWLQQLSERGSEVFSDNILDTFIDRLRARCQCKSVNKILWSPKDSRVSPKALLGELKNLMQEYNTEI